MPKHRPDLPTLVGMNHHEQKSKSEINETADIGSAHKSDASKESAATDIVSAKRQAKDGYGYRGSANGSEKGKAIHRGYSGRDRFGSKVPYITVRLKWKLLTFGGHVAERCTRISR
jgi:hypothetical protein